MELKLNEVGGLLEDLDYPVDVDEVVDEVGDVVVELADGETTLGEVVGSPEVTEASWDDADSLTSTVYSALPTEAVGEPGQSEGYA
ncbi:MAG: DUF5789 family protein [Halobacteriota archaeon]